MQITIGTFNLNNLFSRFNFRGEIDAIQTGEAAIDSTVSYRFDDPAAYTIRTYQGKLIKAKPTEDRQQIVQRIRAMNLDVLAVQEVEDIDTLRSFVYHDLADLYPYFVLVEGNDPRLIDVGLLAKLPIGAITSWRYATHLAAPDVPIFGRDLLEVEILEPTRSRTLLTVYNNHLKSHFVPLDCDPVAGAKEADDLRKRQAETAARIIACRQQPASPFVVAGDMNDPPDSVALAPLVGAPKLGLYNALTNPVETRPAKHDEPPPSSPAWTHRYKEAGKPARYELYDQIWLSPALAEKQDGAWIDRRTRHSGDGSDHDPAWIRLNL
ncbi:MAG: endonuclease/exonuclease/phosphatase family protein [Caldilineaceae bacterium]